MKYSKKGSTLIELEVHILIIIIIFTLSLISYKEIINIFNKSINTLSIYNELDDTYSTLKSILIDTEVIKAEVKNNTIFVYCNSMYKTIINEENTLKIKYFVLTNDDLGNYYYYYENCNALMEDIDNFQVVKNKNLIYIEICKGGVNYIMCL